MLSYNHKSSAELAEKINQNLVKSGHQIWIDTEKMFGNLFDKMSEAIDSSEIVLVFITNEYCSSRYCKQECKYAFYNDKIIIPIKVNQDYNPMKVVGFCVVGLKYVDFSKIELFENSFRDLLKEINMNKNSMVLINKDGKPKEFWNRISIFS